MEPNRNCPKKNLRREELFFDVENVIVLSLTAESSSSSCNPGNGIYSVGIVSLDGAFPPGEKVISKELYESFKNLCDKEHESVLRLHCKRVNEQWEWGISCHNTIESFSVIKTVPRQPMYDTEEDFVKDIWEKCFPERAKRREYPFIQ